MESNNTSEQVGDSRLPGRSESKDASGAPLSLAENFKRYFSVQFADSAEQKHKVYHIRYRVYCDEFGYEPADQFPDLEEYDQFDQGSLHCLIVHKSSGMPAGCVRLVPTVGDSATDPLPFEKHCSNSLDREFFDTLDISRETVCEISRLAVDGAFRRRSGEALTRFGEVDAMDCSQSEKRSFSLIAVAGFLAATALTDLTGRTNVFAMMEPFLPRLMKRSGIVFERAGKDIDYHGIRAPYFIRTQDALENMLPELKELYAWIRVQIEFCYRAANG